MSCDATVSHPVRFLDVPSTPPNPEPLRIIGGQHRSSPNGEVFAISADLRKFQYHERIEPAVLGFAEKDLQRFLGRESSAVRTIGGQCIVDLRDL